MTAVFRDNTGYFVLSDVENIQLDARNNTWSVMFEDYETREVKAQLVEVSQE